jgi:iron complex transport system substrate-binding protein
MKGMKTFGVTALYAKEIRCKKCKRLLMKGEVQAIEIKCPKCGYVQTIDGKGGEKIVSSNK